MLTSSINDTICAISEELTCFLNENPHLEDSGVCHQFGFRELVTSYVFSHLFPCYGNNSKQVRFMDAMDYCNDSEFRNQVRNQIVQFMSESNR